MKEKINTKDNKIMILYCIARPVTLDLSSQPMLINNNIVREFVSIKRTAIILLYVQTWLVTILWYII
jgi:hypothetical protein